MFPHLQFDLFPDLRICMMFQNVPLQRGLSPEALITFFTGEGQFTGMFPVVSFHITLLFKFLIATFPWAPKGLLSSALFYLFD